ncbi:hypothetical protein FRB94_007690 [Tulasnella sp. JGI-2019a]|nr:hypothetical protein FRB94_007690 [Tulasnella sp. JGI-2019a]KAG9026374.1 hypothetical protein FRB95_008913 [Tulasnella sp. JGI-2019a]
MKGHTKLVTSVSFSNDSTYIISRSLVAEEIFVWNCSTQTLLSDVKVLQVIPSIIMASLPCTLDRDGWVLALGRKWVFWLPVDLRGRPVTQGNVLVVMNHKLPIFNVSAYVSSVGGLL